MNPVAREATWRTYAARMRGSLRRIKRVARSIESVRNTFQLLYDTNAIIVHWASSSGASTNWGDKLNPILVNKISGKMALNERDILNPFRKPVYSVIGSFLGELRSPSTVVWGTGFISFDARPRVHYRDIRAVRGPLSREKLEDHGVRCPAVYGDPALLCPKYFPVETKKQHKLGLVPQWRDKGLPIVKALAEQTGAHIIDIQAGIEEFIEEVNSCEYIAASTLHALIVADSYGIPTLWLRLSENPKGDLFKYLDYFASVGKEISSPFTPSENTRAQDMVDRMSHTRIDIDLERLLAACPF